MVVARRRYVLPLLAALLVAGGTSLVAQEADATAGESRSARADDAARGARRVLLFVEPAPQSRFTELELGLLTDSLFASLAPHRETVAVVDWSRTPDGRERTGDESARADPDERRRTQLAFENGCDLWLAVRFTGSPQEPGYEAFGLDLVTRKVALDLAVELDVELRTRDLARRFWTDLVEALLANLETPELGTRVTFVGIEGTTIGGVTADEIELGADGTATLTLPNPNVYTWRAVRRGYDVERGVLEVGDDPVTVRIDQSPAARNHADVALSTLNYLSVAYARYLIPDYLFARARLLTYVVGYSFLASSTQRVSFVSEPLSELSLQVAGYYLPPDLTVRGYAGVSGGVRIVHARSLFGLEPIAPVTAGLVVGGELSLLPRLSVWLELLPTILISRDPIFLAGSIDSDTDSFVIPDIGIGLLDALRFAAGGRFTW